jgi:glycerophosphoryl diester phosphodiesterase
MLSTSRAQLHPCVAHRGWSGGAPENTLAAFRLAMSEPEVRWIELDVHLSRDGVPVVIHDATLGRTTNGRGRVADYTAAQLSRMDAGSWFHPIYACEPIPTLEQVLVLTAGRCRLNIELKQGGDDPDRLARRVADMVRSFRLESETVLTSFVPELIVAARRHRPQIATGLIIDRRPPGLVSALRSLGASFLSIGYASLHPSLLQEAASAGIQTMVWTVNQPQDLRRLAAMPQPFLICTNYPDRWLAAVKAAKRR